jgi:hypothetical protein
MILAETPSLRSRLSNRLLGSLRNSGLPLRDRSSSNDALRAKRVCMLTVTGDGSDTSASKATRCFFFAARRGAGHGTQSSAMARPVFPSGHAPRAEDCEGSDGLQAGGASVLDVGQGSGLRSVCEARFARGRARTSPWCAVVVVSKIANHHDGC